MWKHLHNCLSLAYVFQLGFARSVIDLRDSKWTLSGFNITVDGSVPSQVHLDLLHAGKIGDPYYGNNEIDLRWIAESNWTYTSAPISGLSKGKNQSTFLVFEGLDTFTNISICGKSVGTTNNQFRQWIFDVTSQIQQCGGDIRLRVDFTSAVTTAASLVETEGPSCPFCVGTNFEFPGREFIRKEQSDFGWDWGPAFAPMGIWRPAYIVQLPPSEGVYVTNSVVDVYRQGQLNNLIPDQTKPWVVNISIDYIGSIPLGSVIAVTLLDDKEKVLVKEKLSSPNIASSTITEQFTVSETPELWWPVGYGKQTLYMVTVEIQTPEQQVLATISKRIGFRTIVLNQTPISATQLAQGIAPGSNWNFQINGHEIFCKGSNFIPPDAFWPRVTNESMRRLFEAVVAGNQNMLRVWASGAYLPDFIYDLADELGILMWSEFQFSDIFTPTDSSFLENVAAEAVYQVRRLNHHPSLAVWVGNNELELALGYVGQAAPHYLGAFEAQYNLIFTNLLLHAVFNNTRSISYSPSSITNGYVEFNYSSPVPMVERFFNLTNGSIYGNTDYYNYDPSVAFNISSYPVGRFATEFGFHSMPSLQTWQQVLPKSELYFNSSMILNRNHHYPPNAKDTNQTILSLGGMGEMSTAIQRYYPVPHKKDPVANFAAQCFASQIFQADMYKSEISFYRRGSGMPARTLGALYWQLEDIWQAPTWASIEFGGRWKVLHYTAKDIYQPVIISPFYDSISEDLQVYVTSDLWSSISGTASLTWYDWTGNVLEQTREAPVKVGAINSTKIFDISTRNLTFSLNDAVLYFSVSVEGVAPNSDMKHTYTHTNWMTPVPLSQANLRDPELSLSYDRESKLFTVESKAVAAWTWLDHPASVMGHFDDNGFLLLPGSKKEVRFVVTSDESDGHWVDAVTVVSIWNNTIS